MVSVNTTINGVIKNAGIKEDFDVAHGFHVNYRYDPQVQKPLMLRNFFLDGNYCAPGRYVCRPAVNRKNTTVKKRYFQEFKLRDGKIYYLNIVILT